jgi:hypothetical protein
MPRAHASKEQKKLSTKKSTPSRDKLLTDLSEAMEYAAQVYKERLDLLAKALRSILFEYPNR